MNMMKNVPTTRLKLRRELMRATSVSGVRLLHSGRMKTPPGRHCSLLRQDVTLSESEIVTTQRTNDGRCPDASGQFAQLAITGMKLQVATFSPSRIPWNINKSCGEMDELVDEL
jgi:hypothetical protein